MNRNKQEPMRTPTLKRRTKGSWTVSVIFSLSSRKGTSSTSAAVRPIFPFAWSGRCRSAALPALTLQGR